MGGIGSGRQWHCDSKSTVDELRCIDVRRWAREGFLEIGRRFTWQWSVEGERVASINVQAKRGQIRLSYRSRGYFSDDWESHDYSVQLVSQPCHFGGQRKWFACPALGCGRRVAKLYGGRIFACRHCHQLAYPSTREESYQRMHRRAEAIRAKLGWEAGADIGPKPKGMHWRTFNRLTAQVDALEERSDFRFWEYFAERFGHLADTL